MSDVAVGVLAFACAFAGALSGMFARNVLPEHHLSSDAKDVVKLGMGLVATMTAMILGLLLASAKSEYDAAGTALRQGALDAIKLDRALARYGPETGEIRQMVRHALAQRIELTWPSDHSRSSKLDAPAMLVGLEAIQNGIAGLAPKTDAQRSLQAQALEIAGDVAGVRMLVLSRGGDAASVVFVAAVIAWLTILFLSFGLFAPRNATVTLVLGVSAASVAMALFLILELGAPLDGSVKLSDAPLRFALAQLGQ